jgi:hypothetical protein
VAQISHGHDPAEIHALDWSADGQQLLSGGYDRTVRIGDALRGYAVERTEQWEQRLKTNPDDLDARLALGAEFVQLGWADRARATFAAARDLAPGRADVRQRADDAEKRFQELLGIVDAAEPARGRVISRRVAELLAAIRSSWENNNPEVAIAALRELGNTPGGIDYLPLARSYFSRLPWTATWFPSQGDLPSNLAGWRSLEFAPSAVQTKVRSLNFRYGNRGPRGLGLCDDLNQRGPQGSAFGMLATAELLRLSAGKWRIHARGDSGVRVIKDGRTLIESWPGGAASADTADFEQPTAGQVKFVVEHCSLGGAASLDFALEPVLDGF